MSYLLERKQISRLLFGRVYNRRVLDKKFENRVIVLKGFLEGRNRRFPPAVRGKMKMKLKQFKSAN